MDQPIGAFMVIALLIQAGCGLFSESTYAATELSFEVQLSATPRAGPSPV